MHDTDPLSAAVGERLRALPEEAFEPYGWEEFRRRSTGTRGEAVRGAAAASLSLRAAAAITLVAGASALGAWMWERSVPPATRSIEAGPPPRAAASADAPGAPKEAAPTEAVDPRVRAMEAWLARHPAEPAMVRVGAYATVAGLEDRIAQLDDLLSTARAEGMQSANLSPLEEQRDRLMSSLVQVRFAESLVSESPR